MIVLLSETISICVFCSHCFFWACQHLLCPRKHHLAKEYPCVSEYKAAENIQENTPF